MKVFEHLKLLKSDMEKKEWVIDSFLFKYKQQEFVVLVKLYPEASRKPKYALTELEFLKKNDFNDSLIVPANSVKLLVDAKTLRNYFGIDFNENLGSILQQFNNYLAEFIPSYKKEHKSSIEKEAVLNSLSRSDADDPSKVYCYGVKRNGIRADGTYGERSPYNDNKARLLRETLYNKLNCFHEKHISFCFSNNPDHEKEDNEIIYNWTNKRNY
jgi:hypothetical protein